jgi:O-antigen ligase
VFCLSVLLASLYCIALGSIRYLHTGDSSFLFYHKLVAPVHQHAVYFSLYVFICIAFLADRLKRPVPVGKAVPAMLLIVFFCFLLFLLRSKMVVGFTTLYAVVQLAQSAIRQRKVLKPGFAFNLVVILAVPLALFTANPFSREVGKIKESDLRVLDRQQFDPDQYFDEVQLRLLLWKFSLEVLDSTHDWWAGVSPGDAKFRINEKIVGAHMYTGEPGTADTGFLNYNLHNQYLETLLRSGLAGLILLLAILYVILRAALSAGDEVLLAALLSFAAVFLTESVLERQMGIVPFFFFVCLLHTAKKGDRQGYLKHTADERQA